MFTVSAIIPTYNGTHYLASAVQSALAQTYELLEIIVIDDGSYEDISNILSPFSQKVRYVRQENAGPAAARNHGVSIANGELIAFLDDDDLWHPTKTAEQVKCLIDNPNCVLVYSYPLLIDEEGAVIPNEAPSEFPRGYTYLDFLRQNRIISPSVTLIKKEVINSVGLFDENREYFCGEDYDLWLRITSNYEVEFCPGDIVSYRLRSSGISKNLDNALKGDLYVINKSISRHVIDPKINDREFYAAINSNYYQTFRKFAYNYYYKLNDRTTARRLMLDALHKNPYCPKDILYLFIFSMPETLFRFFRKYKQLLSSALNPLI